MTLKNILLATALAFATCLSQAQAADVVCVKSWGNTVVRDPANLHPSGRLPTPNTCVEIAIIGEIKRGDYEKFADLLRDNHPFVANLFLWSPGGDVEDAIKIGVLTRKALLNTNAPMSFYPGGPRQGTLAALFGGTNGKTEGIQICRGQDCLCASSCFLIWAGGAERQGNFIGLHRPTSKSLGFSAMQPAQASVLYENIMKNISDYLRQTEIPNRYIEIMTGAASNEIRWLTDKEAEQLYEVPSITEWKAASCGHITKQETDRAMSIVNTRGLNTMQNDPTVRAYFQKLQTIGTCGNRRIIRARDAISDVLK